MAGTSLNGEAEADQVNPETDKDGGASKRKNDTGVEKWDKTAASEGIEENHKDRPWNIHRFETGADGKLMEAVEDLDVYLAKLRNATNLPKTGNE